MTVSASHKVIVLGVTGASGALYARRLMACLIDAGVELHLIVSPFGRRLLHDELRVAEVSARALLGREESRLVIHPYNALGSSIASGSMHTDGMVVCPCSSNTLGQIAAGLGGNLITRAAQVTLKERRRLILVPREAPLSHLDIENCLRLSTAGAVICPASPGFYMLPETIDHLVDFVVGKLLDLLDVPHQLNTRWADMVGRKRDGSEANE
jgi:4-hydroxy-3-polyprenylbenzoate decarboxylase